MRLLAFLLSIAISTIRLNRNLSLLLTAGVGICLLLVDFVCFRLLGFGDRKWGTKRAFSLFFSLLFGFLLVQCHLAMRADESFARFWWREESVTFSPNLTSGSSFPFLWFVQVVDTQKWQRYLVQDAEGRRWRLFAQQSYALGDQLFLSAFASPRNDEQVFGSRAWQFRTPEFWEYAFNYDTWLFMHHIAGTLYEQQSLLVSDPASASMMGMKALSGSLGMLDSLRAQLQSFVQSVYGATPYAWLLLGVLIGDISLLPLELYEHFVKSGTVHIVAVSGGNIALLALLLNFLLWWIPFHLRNGLLFLLIIAYALLCGADASVMRASLMGCLTLFALFRGRELSLWRLMRYALVGILLFSPFSLMYDVGLALSFGAVIGIVLMQKWLELLFPSGLPRFVSQYLSPTLWASLGTAPFLLFFMQGVNLLGVLVNLLIVPLMPIITLLGMFSLLLMAIVPWQVFLVPEQWLMDLVFFLAEWADQWSFSLVARWMREKYCLLLGFAIWARWLYRKLISPTVSKKSCPSWYWGATPC